MIAVESRLRRAVSVSTTGRLAARAAGAAGGVVAARLLGPSLRGDLALLVLAATLAATVLTGGLHFWILHRLAGPEAGAGVRAVAGRHLWRVAVVLVGVGLFVVPAGAARFGWAAGVATVTLVLATVVNSLVVAVPNGRLRMGTFTGATVAGSLVYLGWTVALLVAGVASVAWVVVGAAAGALVALVWCRDDLRRLPADVAPAGLHREALRFGWFASLGEVLTTASYRLDLFLVALLLDPVAVGLYAVALAVAEVVLFLPDGVALVVMPHATAHPGDRRTTRLISTTVVACGAGALALAVVSPVALPLVFGSGFTDAWKPAVPLLVGAVAVAAWKVLAADAIARGGARTRASSAAVGTAVMLTADVLLIPPFGLVGAGMASALGSAAAAGHLWRSWRLLPRASA